MNFQVPQFIDEQAKIIGFLTLKQFGFIAVAFIIALISFYYFTLPLALIITIIVGALALVLAFLKINGQPLPKIIMAGISYLWSPRIYTWQRAMKETSLDVSALEKLEAARRNVSIQQKIKSIALSITTSRFFSPAQMREKDKKDKLQVVSFSTGERKFAKRIDYKQ
ncbi:MAG: PrgI family protein [Patescibacteria group bacterium]|nr:PrgI family protein [Patescibacteria group bacterium]